MFQRIKMSPKEMLNAKELLKYILLYFFKYPFVFLKNDRVIQETYARALLHYFLKSGAIRN
jgi:hypothetical protein